MEHHYINRKVYIGLGYLFALLTFGGFWMYNTKYIATSWSICLIVFSIVCLSYVAFYLLPKSKLNT